MLELPTDVQMIVSQGMKVPALDLKSILPLLKVEVEACEESSSLKTHDSNPDNRKLWEKNHTNRARLHQPMPF